MGSLYLLESDLAAYGVTNANSSKVSEASLYIDGWLRRPEGLIWTPDAAGNPTFMAAQVPSYTLSLSTSISPGTNVEVAVTGPLMGVQPGDALIADRANKPKTEAIVVTAKTGSTITLGTVAYAHDASSLLEAGLAIIERRSMPKGRPKLLVKRTPVQRILSGKGRYAYSRRGDAPSGNMDEFNLLSVYSQFGGPPAWEVFNPASTEFDPRTGDVWVPAGIMLAYYTEVELTYVAGFSQAGLPTQIKEVCAKLIRTLVNDPEIGPAKSYRAGDTAIEKFSDSMISGDMATLLQPYRAKLMS
jgi:hypothetical protein